MSASLHEMGKRLWAAVPKADRERCCEHLRAVIPDDVKDQVRAAAAGDRDDWSLAYHHGWGMAIRNELRSVLPEDQLPYPDDHPDDAYRGWDDFYVAAVEDALGIE